MEDAMNSTHTRAPWHAHKGKKTIGIYEQSGVAIGYIHTKMADARLIAAAPEMYAAVKLFVAYHDAQDEGDVAMMLNYADAVEAAKTALAKAEGR
jgi:hypothetical protein